MNTIVSEMSASIEAARKDWGWFLALGIGLIILGIALIVYEGIGTLASIYALGVFLLVAGLMQLAAAFQARGAGHVLLYLLFGALEVFVGFMLIQHPIAGALTVTLLLALYLMFSGIFRLVYSLWAQFPHYGWAAFSGLLAVVLGLLLWTQWPTSAIWFLGFAVGVNFVFTGFAWITLALKLHQPAVPLAR